MLDMIVLYGPLVICLVWLFGIELPNRYEYRNLAGGDTICKLCQLRLYPKAFCNRPSYSATEFAKTHWLEEYFEVVALRPKLFKDTVTNYVLSSPDGRYVKEFKQLYPDLHLVTM